MNYEQKYKASLEQAKKELKTCSSMDCDAARLIFRLFPQLAESEDERVINEIIHTVTGYHPTHTTEEINSMVAYLEKQKEQKPEHLELKAGKWYVCHRAFCCRERGNIPYQYATSRAN